MYSPTRTFHSGLLSVRRYDALGEGQAEGWVVGVPQNAATSAPTPLIIYGSCVTRDMLEFASPPSVSLVDYIARQSWCSIGNPANPAVLEAVRLASPFQNRSFQGDLRGNAVDRIAAGLRRNPGAHLLIDLTDERGGTYAGPDNAVVTRNLDVVGSGVYGQLPNGWERLPFGFLGYSLLFGEAVASLKQSLISLGIWERTTVVGNLWAQEDSYGQQVYFSEQDADAMNPLLSECYDFLDGLCWQVIRMEDVKPVADTDHRWGPSPFHYERAYYQEMSKRVAQRLSHGETLY